MKMGSARALRGMIWVTVALLAVGTASAQDTSGQKFKVPDSLYDAPTAPPAQPPAFQPKPTTVLATVDGAPIVAADLQQEMQNLAQMLVQNRQVASEQQLQGMAEQIQKQAMGNLITRKLLTAQALREKVTVTSAQIDEAVAEIEKRIPAGSSLDAELAKQGGNRSALRMNLEQQLKLNGLMKKHVPQPTPPTAEELEAFYKANPKQFERAENVEVRHVLIKTETTDSEAVKQKKKSDAQALQKALSKGGDFEEIARTRSDCPSKERGGNLGPVLRGQMVPEFEAAAFSQDVGVVGPVVETKFGYHILRVDAKHPAGTVLLEEAKPRLSAFLTQQKVDKAVGEYVSSLQKVAKIEFPTPQN
jgi:peptidyl-prolyl cis-trans isomerase C